MLIIAVETVRSCTPSGTSRNELFANPSIANMAFATPFSPSLRVQVSGSSFCSRKPDHARAQNVRGHRPRLLATAASLRPEDYGTARVKFPSLRPDAFRHPIDVRATRALQAFIGLEAVLRALLRTAELTMFFENIATGVRVGEKQYPSIHAMLLEACDVLDLPVPQLYVRQNPVPNAYTLAVQGNKPFIVIHSSLIELLTPAELQAVLAHELGHLKSEHGVWVTMANLLLLISTASLGGNFGRAVYELLNTQLLLWQRSAEFTCDRAMLLVMQDSRVAMSTLMKLAGGTSKYSDEMDIDEYLSQAEQFDEASSTRTGRLMRESMTATATHPLPILRVRELKRWSESNHFRSLIRSGKPLLSRP